jgi:hypothetical protein
VNHLFVAAGTLLLFTPACAPTADPVEADRVADFGSDSAAEDAPWWEEDRGDPDGDGVNVEDGDCDELRADVRPNAPDDTCDGVDQDCDGAPDDAWGGDPLEGATPVALGDFGDGGTTLALAFAFPNGDVDAYTFYARDEDFAIFDIEAWIYDVPPGVDLALALEWTDADGVARGTVATADAGGPGADELLEWPGEAWEDDSGTYTLHVTAQGGDCAQAYLLQLLVGSW